MAYITGHQQVLSKAYMRIRHTHHADGGIYQQGIEIGIGTSVKKHRVLHQVFPSLGELILGRGRIGINGRRGARAYGFGYKPFICGPGKIITRGRGFKFI